MWKVVTNVVPLRWEGQLIVLDQRKLPAREVWIEVRSAAHAVRLIRSLAVRGAPLIGLVAAYALADEVRRHPSLAHARSAAGRLAGARPTAANLARAVAEVLGDVSAAPEGERPAVALAAARRLHDADEAACQSIAELGAALFPGKEVRLLTHCNTGALATGGIGSAFGIVRRLHAEGRLARLFACEARPVLQGARLTTWEAVRDGIPVTLLADGAAAGLLASGAVDGVVVGADRIAADGSVANKVGTYSLALAAARHGVPLVVAAPTPTFDRACAGGGAIPIEQRAADEVVVLGRRRIAASGVAVYNPAFDVTPPALIAAIVSERGVARPVNGRTVEAIA
jgi:methylthioribose-1-phosphate isomerase